jgi:ABC-2 type transport system ATP-binding protein
VNAIVTRGLCKTYGRVEALVDLNLEVQPGAVFGYLGPNGAGKTTTLRILAGLARSSAGKAWINGRRVGLDSPARGEVGYLPEEPRFYPWMTAWEYLGDFMAGIYALSKPAARRRCGELLEMVGLEGAAKRRVGGFSRGMRQRLGLAQALIARPKVLLLDEPVSALDPAGRHDVLALIEGLRGKATIFMSTHVLADVERVCDRVGILDRGRLIALDTREALLQRYAQPVVEILFEAACEDVRLWAGRIRAMPGMRQIQVEGRTVKVVLADARQDQFAIQEAVLASGLRVRAFHQVRPGLEDVFLQLVGKP